MRHGTSLSGAVWAPGILGVAVLTLAMTDAETRTGNALASQPIDVAAPAVRAARRLSVQPTSLLRQVYPGLTPGQARGLARRRLRRIPLPFGGNFAGIRWEQAMGALAPGEVEQTLQYNARCQWLRAERDGRQPGTAPSVVRLTSQWPALRGVAGRIARPREVADCDASHLREVVFARSRGVAPST